MTSPTKLDVLSRRERQIMTICFSRGEASATEVWQDLPDRPSRTAVRTLLRILEEKGHLEHTKRGRKFIYRPTQPRLDAGRAAFRAVLQTFFGGSIVEGVAAHLREPATGCSDQALKTLAGLIRKARRKLGK